MQQVQQVEIEVINPLLFVSGNGWQLACYDENEFIFVSPELNKEFTSVLDFYFYANKIAEENKGTELGNRFLAMALSVTPYLVSN